MKAIEKMAAIGMVMLLAGCSEPVAPLPQHDKSVSVMQIETPLGDQIREFNGQVVPAEVTPLSFRITGEMEQVLVKPGQKIQQGQLLAKLDDRKLQQDLADALARVELTSRQFSRADTLLKRQMVSPAEHDELKANDKLARVNLRHAQMQIEYSQLIAPFSGVVGKTPKKDYETANAGETVLEIYRSDLVYIYIQVPDVILAQIDVTQASRNYSPLAQFSGHKGRYELDYLEHTSQPSPQTQTFDFWLKMPQIEPPVLPGSSATIFVDLNKAGLQVEEGFLIPITALQPSNMPDSFNVWKVVDGRAHIQSVKTGAMHTNGIVISEGLAVGDTIITSGLASLRNGQAVNTELVSKQDNTEVQP